MFQSFRQSMTWLHTWFGLVLGFVLMVVFFFGSLSVFDREIDRWAIPETRFAPQAMPSFDQRLEADLRIDGAGRRRTGGGTRSRRRPAAEPALPLMNWSAYTTHRDPVLAMYAEFAVPNNPDDPRRPRPRLHHDRSAQRPAAPARPAQDRQRVLLSDALQPASHWRHLGYWIVGFAALVMLAALVSGVVMHRKIFRELFTFRPRKAHAAQHARPAQPHRRGRAAVPLHVRAVGPDHLRGHLFTGRRDACCSRRRTSTTPGPSRAHGPARSSRPACPRRSRRWTRWWPRRSGAGPRAACRARSATCTSTTWAMRTAT